MAHPQTSTGYPSLEEIKQKIQEEFPGADVAGIRLDKGQIIGNFVWGDFVGVADSVRNRMVTERIRWKLGLRALNIGVIVPLAPGEESWL